VILLFGNAGFLVFCGGTVNWLPGSAVMVSFWHMLCGGDFCKLNYIYKDSETLSLSTVITIPFSIPLTHKYYLPNIKKQAPHYPHNLSSIITLYFIHR